MQQNDKGRSSADLAELRYSDVNIYISDPLLMTLP